MTEQEAHPTVVRRVIIKFLIDEGVKISKFFTRLKSYVEDTTTVTESSVRGPENFRLASERITRRKTIRKQRRSRRERVRLVDKLTLHNLL